jgi:hypothetical protein
MPIHSEFKKLLKDKDIRFTVVLGSGFHSEALGSGSVLSSWPKLLKELDPDLILTGYYPLDYEQLIIRRASKQTELNASEIEKEIFSCVSNKLKSEQDKVLSEYKSLYPTGIFNPKKVSDIISLNFDTVAERICCEVAGVKSSKRLNIDLNSDKNGPLKVPYSLVDFPNGESIRFWYPHGSIHKSDKIILGTREYAKHISEVERLRNHSKKLEKKGETKDITWYHQLTHQPVLILGAELSPVEWDIWFAIVNRERNFSKSQKINFKKQIFQMFEGVCLPDHRDEWFEPLITGMKYKEQWSELHNLFNI